MSCNEVGRDLFIGSAREQLISELELALKKAKDPESSLVKFNVLDYEVEYYFDEMGSDVEKVYKKDFNQRHILQTIGDQRYFIEPKGTHFFISRYNNSEERLERLNRHDDWEFASWYGKKFRSATELVEYFLIHIDPSANRSALKKRVYETFGYS
ncbi:hypothetical protein ACQEXU_21365 [Vibrio sp. TRT 21S02]|uniref:hypothetical protein n=1 Tax=Vibrio sp. TRT 21S02 TaxID=3418507 RepID=UPI003CF512D8